MNSNKLKVYAILGALVLGVAVTHWMPGKAAELLHNVLNGVLTGMLGNSLLNVLQNFWK